MTPLKKIKFDYNYSQTNYNIKDNKPVVTFDLKKGGILQ